VAALLVSGPVYWLTEDELPAVGRRVVAAALRVSERLGYLG
jgi:DNA-binding IclR family transcriptional regulator